MEEDKIVNGDFQKVEEPQDLKNEKLSYEELEYALGKYKELVSIANDTMKKQLEEIQDTNDKYLRALADYQNLQRNSAITISKSKDAGKIAFIKDLLPVIDNFEKAIDAGEVTEGIMLIYNNLQSVLKSNKVEVINPEIDGTSEFNDSLYEAIASVPVQDNYTKNSIAFVQLKGYKMGDNIIRYAKVGVYV